MSTFQILFVKTGALGDVLRTTSVLPGLVERHPDRSVTWVTATAAADLVRTHPLVDEVLAVDPQSAADLGAAAERLGAVRWDWCLSLDDEEPLCRLATGLGARRLSGAYLDRAGQRRYTADVAPWFDMGLLSILGKERADALKIENRRSHPEIFAGMLGVPMGRPELCLPDAALERARVFAAEHELERAVRVIGLNTGAGGRWRSKALPVDRTVALARALDRAVAETLGGRAVFLVLGGPEERERNDRILAGLAGSVRAIDAGTDNPLLDFAARIDRCDLLVSSDSLALHVAIARDVPTVAFFAPTSAAEIELYGRGEKVASTAPDACSYRPDADTETLTVDRLAAAARGPLGL